MRVTKSFLVVTAISLLFSSIMVNAQNGAFYTGEYKNMFKDVLGKTDAEIDAKVEAAFQHFFYGTSDQKLYYESGTDMAYILDVANNDVRSEGMSYGLMICVQLDKQEEFNKLWRYTKAYMQHSSGDLDGFFRWQLNTSGSAIDNNPAPDGEAYFITALFFAAHRWGNGTGIFDYEAEAQATLQKVQSKTGAGGINSLFNTNSKLITFGPNGGSYDYTDPSYNLPGFFELWAMWSTSNTAFWQETPAAARKLIRDASHSTSGLSTDYSEFDGTPKAPSFNADANKFMYDAWRTIMNLGMDYHWFEADAQQPVIAERYLNFFKDQGDGYVNHYNWDGSNGYGDHSTGLVACNAAASLAVDNTTLTTPFLNEFWSVGLPSGTYRYYDGMLYMLAFLNCSGNFKIYKEDNGPIVKIESPASGEKFETGADITIEASASVSSGSITTVEFYNGTELLGEDATEPYSVEWLGVEAGTYTIKVVATDDAGNEGFSTRTVKVSAPAYDAEITINAMGAEGTENIELVVDGVTIDSWTLTTSFADYTATANANGVIQVHYTNDEGDRDAEIDYIIVAGTTYEAEDQEINTGYYANGSCGGGSHSQLMHCGGYIEFETTPVIADDECPNDPNKTEAGICGCGVPEGTCSQKTISLKAGWNLIGYPFDGKATVEEALSSIIDNVVFVKDTDGFYDANGSAALNSLTELEYGKGYYVQVDANCEIKW